MKISCKQAVDYILKKEEQRLTKTKRFALWNHLQECPLCRRFMTQNRIMSQAVVYGDQQHTMSVAEKEAIIREVLERGGGL